METFKPNETTKKQLELIKLVFLTADEHNKFIFLKGGWNIDLSYGKITREHEDVDFHYNVRDKIFWQEWYSNKGFTKNPQTNFYTIYNSPDDYHVDMGGLELDKNTITWNHGGIAEIEEVVKEKKFETMHFLGMKLNVEKYLKLKHKDFGKRKRDTHDLNILNELLSET